MSTTTTIKGYKGFDRNLKCRDFQYEVGKSYEMDGEVEACKRGFHFCENPIDIFNHYTPATIANGDTSASLTRFAEVEGSGAVSRDDNDSKVAVSKLHISVEISLAGLLKAGVKFILDRVKWDDSPATNTGNRSAATNTGNRSAATNTGNRSAATNTGDQSAATNTGNRSAATNTGDQSAATNTGDQSAATVNGNESVAISVGAEGRAKGALGCWIVLAEWSRDDNYDWHRKDVRVFKVDGETIKADTFYILTDGNPIECNEA